jgi:hypothetical protein
MMVSSIDELVMDVRTSELVSSQPLSEILILDLPTMAGPTRTQALGAGSPAIDAINHGTCPPSA